MIQANEVRQGNLIEYDGRYFEIDVIASEFPTLKTIEFGFGVVGWDNINPIPITAEMGMNGGVECVNTDYKIFEIKIREDLSITILFSKNTNAYVCVNESETINVIHLHQLQNLYQSIAGLELEVKL